MLSRHFFMYEEKEELLCNVYTIYTEELRLTELSNIDLTPTLKFIGND